MRVLVTGGHGQLGSDITDVLVHGSAPGGLAAWSRWPTPRHVEVVAPGHGGLPVDDRGAVLAMVEAFRPEVVVHTAAYTAVDGCEVDPDRALRVNSLGTRHVAEAAKRSGAQLVYVSTDYVFDGTSERPYHEWDEPHPLSVYGRSKLGGERECPPEATIVRTSWVCGARGANVVRTVLRLAAEGQTLRFVDDQRGSPTFSADLAVAVVGLALDRRPGVHHVTNQGATSWYGLVRAVLKCAGIRGPRVQPIATAELDPPRPAPRPANSVLDNAVLRLAELPTLPDWQDGLARLVAVMAKSPT